jgi:hypothetical protein
MSDRTTFFKRDKPTRNIKCIMLIQKRYNCAPKDPIMKHPNAACDVHYIGIE